MFLSAEWVEALGARAAAADRPESLAGARLVVEHRVDGHGSWQVGVVDGAIHAGPPTVEPDVTMTMSYETAATISRGQRSALDAFMAGEIRLGGDPTVLADHAGVLADVGDALALDDLEISY